MSFDALLAGQRPAWYEDIEQHLRDAKAEGWVVKETIEFHWTGPEDAVFTLDPEDIDE